MINCRKIAAQIKEELKAKVSPNKKLAIIKASDYAPSEFYIKNKLKDCAELGIPTELIEFTNTEEDECLMYDMIFELNDDPTVAGIIIQLPLYEGWDEQGYIGAIADEKDVDGFKATSKYIPATPKGVLTILNHVVGDLDGRSVCLIGRGKLCNHPLIQLLLDRNATVTVCHSHTVHEDLKNAVTHADIVITAVGIPDFITRDLLRINGNFAMNPPGCIYKNNEVYADPVIIDVGISRVDGKQVGDVAKEVHDLATYCTPWTNGVGLMTRVSLLQNLLED